MAALNLMDFINTLATQQQPAPPTSVDAAPPVPGATAVPGGGSDQSSPLGTVLATLRRIGPGPRGRAMLGGTARPAPSKGGAVAQGFMQAMDNAKEYDAQQAKLQQVLDAFNYRKAKDQLDFEYKKSQDEVRNRQAQERLDTWRKVGRGKGTSKLAREKSVLDVLGKDPEYAGARDALANDDTEIIQSRKLTPEARDALKAKMKEREAAIRRLAQEDDGEDDGGEETPKAAPVRRRRNEAEEDAAEEAAAGTPPPVPMPPPRPAGLGTPPPAPAPAPEPTPAPAPAPVRRAPSAAAIEALKANPDRADEFDAKFGPGAAASVFGLPPPAPNFGRNY